MHGKYMNVFVCVGECMQASGNHVYTCTLRTMQDVFCVRGAVFTDTERIARPPSRVLPPAAPAAAGACSENACRAL